MGELKTARRKRKGGRSLLAVSATVVLAAMVMSLSACSTFGGSTDGTIGILKNYVDDLEDNLGKMSKQIGSLRGQMRKLKNIMEQNSKDINQNMLVATKAKEQGNEKHMLLASRKAARLKETNQKYQALHSKMTILYRVLNKMYKN